MGTHSPQELLDAWKKEDLSFDRVTGHSLQNIVDLAMAQTKTEAKTNGLEHTTQNIAQDQEKLQTKLENIETILLKLLTLAEAEWQGKATQAELKALKQDLISLKSLPVKTTKRKW